MGVLKTLVAHRMVRKVGIVVAGFSVLLVGLLMIVLPGPAVVVIPLGLTILGKEFNWARRLMTWLQAFINRRLSGLRRLVGRAWTQVTQLNLRSGRHLGDTGVDRPASAT